jgi:hypothetical protein
MATAQKEADPEQDDMDYHQFVVAVGLACVLLVMPPCLTRQAILPLEVPLMVSYKKESQEWIRNPDLIASS